MNYTFTQIIALILSVFVLIFLIVFLFSQFWIDISNMRLKRKFGLPYVPTSRKRLKKIMEFANIKPEDKVIDLGSGDGRMVIAAAKLGATATGYELNPTLVTWARLKIKLSGLSKKAKIINQDLFKADFNEYNVFLLYAMPWVMDELQNRLKEIKYDKIRIISNTFQFGNWEPKLIAKKEKVYLYEIEKKDLKK